MNIQIKRSNRKTMSIIIRDGELLVRAPFFVSDKQIEAFVESKKSWIEKKLSEHQPMGFAIGMSQVRIFSEWYSVRFIPAAKFGVYLAHDLTIEWPLTMSEKRCIELVELHFKHELARILAERVPFYAKQLHLKTPDFTIRRYKRLYGRCTKDHRLAFNTYLFHDSLEFIDYVVLHECAHILEFNHSKQFYAIIEEHMPNYKAVIAANKSSNKPHPDQ